ncbi:MAG TPA: hypothetical protein VHV55_22295 [Pirellulales bacterium]|jgi:hypothetical protein|nr:hypothetical protein [Pirellulales bacterium]
MLKIKSKIRGQVEPTGGLQHGGIKEDQFEHLAQLWHSHRTQSLEVRHQTGAILNQWLGVASERQPYGRQILADVSARLHVSQSELHRMRWFAQKFASVADYLSKHPGLATWSGFKGLLPSLISRKRKKVRRVPNSLPSPKMFRDVARSIDHTIAKLERLDSPVDPATRQAVISILQGKIEVLLKYLGLKVSLSAE